jgi:predicted RNase H-like nuclease (RuvC/YqgF family)
MINEQRIVDLENKVAKLEFEKDQLERYINHCNKTDAAMKAHLRMKDDEIKQSEILIDIFSHRNKTLDKIEKIFMEGVENFNLDMKRINKIKDLIITDLST